MAVCKFEFQQLNEGTDRTAVSAIMMLSDSPADLTRRLIRQEGPEFRVLTGSSADFYSAIVTVRVTRQLQV